ncbi:MAG: chromosomal replication initiator protein DnaA, partial [Candidatus Schekmanbacteria bacterium RBG_16_38_10]
MNQLTQQVKEDVLRELQRSVHSDLFNTWCKNLDFITTDNNLIRTPVPNKFYQEYFERELRTSIQDAFLKVLGRRLDVIFEISEHQPERTESQQLVTDAVLETPREATSSSVLLNENYTFENFVVGPSNRMAYAGAIAVSESPAKKYNPLFIHGAVGLGKTHLLQAICNSIIKRNSNTKVIYLSCENFINDYVYAIQKGAVGNFRKRYRNADVLLIDDIHFLSNVREASHEEFFHTFNALHTARKQIILSSDSSPNDIPKLEERLVSRFGWGLSARIDPPDYETRIAIIKRRLELIKREFPDDVISYIAANVQDNIRHIEGTITNIVAMASLSNVKIDMELAGSILKSIGNVKQARITIPTIIQVVTKYYNIKPDELRACSLKEIGAHFGGKDHSTVIYSIGKIENMLSKNSNI